MNEGVNAIEVPMTPAYRGVIRLTTPVMTRWARLAVTGLDHLPSRGPTLLVANHESYWDPIAIAVAARSRRQVRALAKSTLWKVAPVAWLMNGMGHIPIVRGAANEAAISTATKALADGACIGVFPEATRSLGRSLRARSGAGRLILSVPGTQIVCVRVLGATDVVRIPKRPNISVEFFAPRAGGPQEGEDAAALMTRLTAEIREAAPYDIPGRRHTAAKHRRKLGSEVVT